MPSQVRPRRNIRVACENCRIARVRCDGARQSCLRCVQRSLSCVYETNTGDETRRETFRRGQRVRDQLLTDIRSSLDVLRHASDEEAVEMLRHIRSSQDSLGALAAISTHRQLFTVPLIARGLNSAPDTGTILPFQYELMMQHPQIYPIVGPLVHVDGDLAALEPSHMRMIIANPNASAEHLSDVQFEYWTKVPIGNDEAAHLILHYLETDHPILGLFDAELFLRSLKDRTGAFCSEFLLSCSSVLENARLHKPRFHQETRECWETLKNVDDITSIAACQLFSLACACEGQDLYAQELKTDGYEMGKRLGIFESRSDRTVDLSDPPDVRRWTAHVAWGVYNWLSLHGFHYRQSPIGEPPSLPIPGDVDEITGYALSDLSSPFMAPTITSLSKFWRILHPIIELWMPDQDHYPLSERFTLAAAENTFRKLLAWADDNLSEANSTEPACRPHHVLVMHMWFHTATMEIFRPFYGKHSNLRTFGSRGSTTEVVFWCSLTQLERLALEYRQNHPSASSSIFWHLSLLFIGNAVIRNPVSSAWRFNFLLCMYGYADLAGSFNVANGFLRAILYMAIQNKLCQPAEARAIMQRLPDSDGLDSNNANGSMPRFTSSHVVDLEQALENHSVSQITDFAAKLDDALMFDDFIDDSAESNHVDGEILHEDTNENSTTSGSAGQ